jgi:hypothetical protein
MNCDLSLLDNSKRVLVMVYRFKVLRSSILDAFALQLICFRMMWRGVAGAMVAEKD